MDLCVGQLAEPLRQMARDFGWTCLPLQDGRAQLTSGRRYADAEPVQIFVSIQGDIVTLSDGGESVGRLALSGFDLEDEVHEQLWRDALHEFRVGFADGVVQVSTSLDSVAHRATRLADALVGLDTLRLVAFPTRPRKRTFADSVEDYIRHRMGEQSIVRSPVVRIDDISVRPTLRVRAKKGNVFVQAAATTSWNTSFEHAFWTFSLFDRAPEIPVSQRLIVLGGTEATWGRPRMRLLAEVAYVGIWADRGPIDDFLDGRYDGDRILT